MPRWPIGYVARAWQKCPACGGKKDFNAKACRPCSPKPAGHVGIRGPLHPAWKGGFRIDRDGYVKTYAPNHPWPRRGGYVFEHVRIVEIRIGRRLHSHEIVHHVDHDRSNNTADNLRLMTRGEHSSLHAKENAPKRRRGTCGRFA